MPRYEYKIVPAPAKGLKGKGVKGAEARFAFALEALMNEMAGDGWEYQRAETLPSIERSGLTGSTTEWRNVLVFRRLKEDDAAAYAPELLPPPAAAPVVAAVAAPAAVEAVAENPSPTADEIARDALQSYEDAAQSAVEEAPVDEVVEAVEAVEAEEERLIAPTETPEANPLSVTLSAVRNASKTDG